MLPQAVPFGYYQNRMEEKKMFAKILCFVGGAVFGLVITSCCVIGGQDDERNGCK